MFENLNVLSARVHFFYTDKRFFVTTPPSLHMLEILGIENTFITRCVLRSSYQADYISNSYLYGYSFNVRLCLSFSTSNCK